MYINKQTDVFTEGKYKGKTFQWLEKHNKPYLWYAYRNKLFNGSKSIERRMDKLADELYNEGCTCPLALPRHNWEK